ncbi:MAG: NYN domain-containing protein [Coriobacteriia bacterium]
MSRFIIDGYNVIGSSDRYRVLADVDMDTARARLVEDLTALTAPDRHVTAVFDGAGNPSSDGAPHHVAGVTVFFSRAGESADSLIEALAARSRERAEETVVVTSDAQTQWTVMGGRVARMSSAEFVREMITDSAERREHVSHEGRRGRLEERIDPSVRAVLARWARG